MQATFNAFSTDHAPQIQAGGWGSCLERFLLACASLRHLLSLGMLSYPRWKVVSTLSPHTLPLAPQPRVFQSLIHVSRSPESGTSHLIANTKALISPTF